MNDHYIETIIQEAETQVRKSSMFGARLMGTVGVFFGPFAFLNWGLELGVIFGGVVGIVTASLWNEGRKFNRGLTKSRARTVWQEIDQVGAFKEDSSLKQRELFKDIGRIYDRDPQGQIFPLPQAIRLTLAWKQQQQRLQTLTRHIEQMRIARTTLQEKQNLLRELGEESAGLERALVRLNDDIEPLESNRDALRASCARLESLIVEVDATLRRRELHSEVRQLTTQLSPGTIEAADPFDSPEEQLELERQIAREIETYLQLERETDAHLRDL